MKHRDSFPGVRACPFIVLGLVLLASACRLSSPGSTPSEPGYLILDMVHHNPGEALTQSAFTQPDYLAGQGYTGMVVNDFTFIHTAIPFQKLDPGLFPPSSAERIWMDSVASVIDARIASCPASGIKVYYFTDIIVLPVKIKEIYASEICTPSGKIDFSRPKTQLIHRLMVQEIFERFPELDGLVVRTGETYLHNVPFHTGNNPILDAADTLALIQTHTDLIGLLREEVCEKLNKTLVYRTWYFGFFHTEPQVYLGITTNIPPHPNLYFAIKHPKGDYHRTFPFNPTLGIGDHKQIVEVQCQREYEGKGAYPNYVMQGVIDGFEELSAAAGYTGLNDLKHLPTFAGVWSWSRGGGWVGPYIQQELWCDLNAYVLCKWAADPSQPEPVIFSSYAEERLGLSPQHAETFRRLCLLSARAVVRGHGSLLAPVNVWWTRDQFMGGLRELQPTFDTLLARGLAEDALAEKAHAASIWDTIVVLSDQIPFPDLPTAEFARVSARYGQCVHYIYAAGWAVLLYGYIQETTGVDHRSDSRDAIQRYDAAWREYRALPAKYPACPTLYQPFAFKYVRPHYQDTVGMHTDVDKYRRLIR